MTATTERRPPGAGVTAVAAITEQRPPGPGASPRLPNPLARGAHDGQPEAGPAAVTIRLLGRFAVDRDGQEIALRAFGGRLARRLLRLLALRRGALVPKEQIAEALWPTDPPADAIGNIEVLVSRIRGALGDRTLVRAGPGGYVLADDGRCWVDAEMFVAAVQEGRARLAERPAGALGWFRDALDIWRGDPLAEDTYAEWAQADRRLLGQAFLEALDGAATAALSLTDTTEETAANAAEAASWARQALTAEPLRETSALLLVRALAAAGDRAGALAAFDDYRDRLARETGLDPTPGAREVRQHILTGESRPAHPQRRVAARPADSGRPVLGRQQECAVIADVTAGRGPRVVLVTGPSGVGKSALLAEAARRAAGPVLSAQAFPADQGEAWSLAGRLLRQATRRLPGPAAEVLAQPEAGALAEVVPGLSGLPGAIRVGLAEEDRQASAFRGAVRLVAAVARPRCLIVIDDLQWADPVSLALLGLLIRTVDGVRLAAACRPAADPGLAAAEAFGVQASEVTTIMLNPLPDDVIRDLFGDRLLAETMLRQAAGSPFTVTEVAGALTRQGAIARDHDQRWRLRPGRDGSEVAKVVAAGLQEAARNRLTGLTAASRDVLGLLALLGRPASAALLAAATGADLRATLYILEGLADAGLARVGTQGWTLTHEPGGQAIRGTMSLAGTTRWHALLAGALRQYGADPAEIASHLAAGGDREEAAAAYAAAARGQLERVSDREAERLAEAGLTLDPPGGDTRASLLEVRGEAARRGGRLEAARADFTAALDSLSDPAGRSRVLACLAILDARTAGAARGGELAELAIAEAGRRADVLGQALAAGAIIDLTGGNLARAYERWRRARRLLDQAGDSRGGARLLYWQAMAGFIGGRLRGAVAQLDHLARLPAGRGEILRLWNPRATRGHALAFLGRAAEGLAEIDEALACARTTRHRAVEAECLWHRSEALAIGGRPGEAIESAAKSAAIATRIGHAEWTAAAHRGLGVACEAAGLPGRAESAYRRSVQDSRDLPFFRAWAHARLGACLARQGQAGAAAPHVRAALAGGIPLIRFEARWAHAELLASRGEDEARRAVATAALEAARHDGYQILIPRLRELAG